MSRININTQDQELIEKARLLILRRQKEDWHAVSSALRTRTGKIHEGLHLEAYVGRIAVCAEAIAIGAAAVEADPEIETIVAVDKNGQIVSPCGMCRELIADYSPQAMVILQDEAGVFKTPIKELLPFKYARK
jgi:cytidine deaminase